MKRDSAIDILDRLSKESRRLRLGVPLPDGPLSWELVQRVHQDFVQLLDQPGVTLDGIARAMGEGYSRGTLSRFKNMAGPEDYVGDADKIVRGVNQFLENLAGRSEHKPEGFVETEVAKRILIVVQKTIELQSIGLIYSDAGRGKSISLKAAAAIHPGTILMRVTQFTRTPSGFARQLAKQLQLRASSQSLFTAQAKIIEKLKDTGRLLIIDEAHQCKPDCLEFIRDIHDETGVPIILAGTMKISEAVDDADMFFGQFSSRIALRYNITEDLQNNLGGDDPRPLHSIAEIRTLFETDKVRLDDEARLLIAKIANLPGLGGLRLCTKIVQVASAVAGDELITAKLVLRVLRTMHGKAHAVGRIEKAIQRSRVLVA